MTVSQIIDTLGGTSAVARALGAPISTVHSWRDSNYVPAWRQAKLLELAIGSKVALSVRDFPDRTKAAA